MKIDFIFFDLDGVLVQSEHLYTEAKKKVLEKYNISVDVEEIEKYQGWMDYVFFEQFKIQRKELKIPTDILVKESEEYFQSIHKKMLPIEGAVDFIHRQHAKEIKLANVTSASMVSQEAALNILSVKEKFDFLVNGDSVKNHKPHPEPYLLALNKAKSSSLNILAIEDSIAGIKSAKAAGLKVVGFGSSFDKNILLEAGADFYVRDYVELSKHL